MSSLFQGAAAFYHNLGDWNISNVTMMDNMLDGSGLSKSNYDATLTGWAAQNTQADVKLGASGLTYCEAATARTKLIQERNWIISGDIEDCPPIDQPVTGILEEDFYPLEVFPNPADGYIHVQFPSGTERRIINLTDLQGRVLSTTDTTSKEEKIEVQSLPAGLYMLHVIEGTTLVRTVRLIKR